MSGSPPKMSKHPSADFHPQKKNSSCLTDSSDAFIVFFNINVSFVRFFVSPRASYTNHA